MKTSRLFGISATKGSQCTSSETHKTRLKTSFNDWQISKSPNPQEPANNNTKSSSKLSTFRRCALIFLPGREIPCRGLSEKIRHIYQYIKETQKKDDKEDDEECECWRGVYEDEDLSALVMTELKEFDIY